jgi:hypothetical protein
MTLKFTTASFQRRSHRLPVATTIEKRNARKARFGGPSPFIARQFRHARLVLALLDPQVARGLELYSTS